MKKPLSMLAVLLAAFAVCAASISGWGNERERYETLLCRALQTTTGGAIESDLTILERKGTIRSTNENQIRDDFSDITAYRAFLKGFSTSTGSLRCISILVFPKVSNSGDLPTLYLRDRSFTKELFRNRITSTYAGLFYYKWDDPGHLLPHWVISDVSIEATQDEDKDFLVFTLISTIGKNDVLIAVDPETCTVISEKQLNRFGAVTYMKLYGQCLELSDGGRYPAYIKEWRADNPSNLDVTWVVDFKEGRIDDEFFSEEYLFALI